jgi:E3 ubiquitin-protein ligase BRE1
LGSSLTEGFSIQQRFQKDAIWRQMQEYKRDKVSLEAKLKESAKATAYHADHLRVIDAWYNQLIDEVKLLLGSPDEDSKGRFDAAMALYISTRPLTVA